MKIFKKTLSSERQYHLCGKKVIKAVIKKSKLFVRKQK